MTNMATSRQSVNSFLTSQVAEFQQSLTGRPLWLPEVDKHMSELRYW